jgi:trigger factor
MRTTVEPLDGNKVRLSVEIDEDEFDQALDAAFRKIAREVRIPGFRPGKAPRRLLEAKVGSDVARDQALRDSLPEYYARAVNDNGVDPIAPPEIDITAGQEEGPLAFDAVVEVRPRVQVPGYGGLRVVIPRPEATEAEVDEQIDRLRAQSGTLTEVERPARDGDFVTIDVQGSRGGEPVEGLTVSDYLHKVGAGSPIDDLDPRLHGSKLGDILEFDSGISGQDEPASVRVFVKNVQELVLPDVTDEWAAEASEFDTADALRAEVTRRITSVKQFQAAMALREQAVNALVELIDDEPPDVMVEAELGRRVRDLEHRLEHENVPLAAWLQATGKSGDDIIAEMRPGAVHAVKADLGLRAIADAEAIAVTDADLDAEIERLATRMGEKPNKLRRALERNEQISAVSSDLRKGKALAWLVDHVDVVDTEGNPIDRAGLGPVGLEDEDHHDHDHHDHDHGHEPHEGHEREEVAE